MSNETEVIQHVQVPSLNLLIGNNAPEIFSSRSPRKPVSSRAYSERSLRNPRFSSIRDRDTYTPGDIPIVKRNKSRKIQAQTLRSAELLNQIESDQRLTDTLGQKVEAYSSAHRMKALLHERDYIDNFFAPLQQRIKEEFTGEKYRLYKHRQSLAVQRMDQDPIPIRSRRQPHVIVTARVSTAGLRDPSNKHIDKLKKEDSLSRFVAKTNLTQAAPRRVIKDSAFNHQQNNVLLQTRFYLGNDENANKMGRKAFNSPRSKVPDIMNEF